MFLQEGKQQNDGSFKFAPNNRLYKGECEISKSEVPWVLTRNLTARSSVTLNMLNSNKGYDFLMLEENYFDENELEYDK